MARFRRALPWVIGAFIMGGCGGGNGPAQARRGGLEETLGIDKAGLALRQTHVEELVQACMKRSGFEYVPVDPNATKAAISGTSGLSDDEYRRQFGYGISTVFEKVLAAARARTSADPNVVYRSHLDPAGQAAFDQALTGGKLDVSVSGAVDAASTGDLSGLGGCVQEATTAVFGDSDVVTALSRFEELDQRTEADPRMVAAKERWAKCMKNAGFDYSEPNAVDGAISDKLAAIVGPEAARTLGQNGTFSPLSFRADTVAAYDHDALARLQVEEIATAQADLKCEESYVTDVEAKVRDEYEKKFAAQNAALITQAQTRLGVAK